MLEQFLTRVTNYYLGPHLATLFWLFICDLSILGTIALFSHWMMYGVTDNARKTD